MNVSSATTQAVMNELAEYASDVYADGLQRFVILQGQTLQTKSKAA